MSNSEDIPEKLGSFRIESVIGSGAMGVVYRATNEANGRPAAVKVVSGEMNQQSKLYERFKREAAILQQFRHPHIVRFLAVGKFRGTSYIAMEFVQGVTLEKILQDRGPLPWREVVNLATQICDALQYAHDKGVVHRDLKPSNLMVNEEGKIKLTDFGIAKDLDKTALTATGRTLGTAAYMSPEQIRGTPAVSHKSDLYALGIVLYQMLVGKPPFEGNSPVVLMHCHLNEPPPRASSKITEIPKALDELILSLMAKAPQERPWDAAAVANKLRGLEEKIAKGAAIAMVWPSAQNADSKPIRPGASGKTPERASPKSRKSRSATGISGSSVASALRSPQSIGSWLLRRESLEIGLLVLGLIAIGSFIAYWIWPYSEGYLYRQAEALMVSPRRSDWIHARDEYFDELDRRFPNHPWHEQTQKWRDKISLEEAIARAKFLTGPIQSEPANHGEGLYKIASTAAGASSRQGDDQRALDLWRKLAEDLNTDNPDDRPFYLLAVDTADKLERTMKDRRADVEAQILAWQVAVRSGRGIEADAIKNKLIEQYGQNKDVAELLAPLAAVPEPVTPATQPVPAAASASTTPAASATTDSAGTSEERKTPETTRRAMPADPGTAAPR